jgi:hypothetical protein
MQTKAKPNGAERLLLVLLTAWALAMIVPGLYRVFDPLSSFGLSVDNDGVVVDVVAPFTRATESPAGANGIVPGDRIDLRRMRCIPIRSPQCGSVLSLLGGMGGMQSVLPNRQITLQINPAAGGQLRTVTLDAAPAPLSTAERLTLLADTLVGIIVILTAFRLVWQHPCRMTWGLFLYVIWFNPGQSFAYYAVLQLWPGAVLSQELAEAVAHGAAFVGLTTFALRFPHDRTEQSWRRLERALPWLGALITLLTLLSFGSGFGIPSETNTRATFLVGYAIDAGVLVILLKRRRTLSPPDRQRMHWVIWGCAIGLPAFIFAEVSQSAALVRHLWGISLSPAMIGLLYLPNGVLVYFASKAVQQPRVVRVSIPLRHGTILSVLTLAVAVPMVHLHEALSHYRASLDLPEWAWLFVVSPVLLVLLQRLDEICIELVDHVCSRRFHRSHLGLKAGGERMMTAKTPEEIDRLLLDCPMHVLALSSAAVFRKDNDVFRRTAATPQWTSCAVRELGPEEHEFALRCIEQATPIRLCQTDCERHDFPAGLGAPCLAVPVQTPMREASAVVLYGPHENGTDIDRDECDMLAALAARAAAAYEHVHTILLQEEVARLRSQITGLRTA